MCENTAFMMNSMQAKYINDTFMHLRTFTFK